MARGGRSGPFRRALELFLDRRSAERTQRETQEALNKGTDPKTATRNLGMVGKAMQGLRALASRLVVDLVGAVRMVGQFLSAVGDSLNAVENAQSILRRATGDTGATFNQLKRDLRGAFATGPEDIETVARAMGSLRTSTGLLGRDLQQLTRITLDFARVNDQEAGAAADQVGQLLNRFGLQASAAEGLLDRLTLASQATGISVSNLGNALLAAGPQLSSLGLSINDQIALISQLERVGADVPGTIMGIQQAMTRLANNGATDLQAAFQNLLTEIRQAPSDVDALRIASEAFGTRVASRMVPDIRSGRFEFAEFSKQVADAGGTLRDTERDSRTLQEQLARSTNLLGGEMLPAVQAVSNAVRALGIGLSEVLRWAIRTVQLATLGLTLAWIDAENRILRLRIAVHEWTGQNTTDLRAQVREGQLWRQRVVADIEEVRSSQQDLQGETKETADAFAALQQAVAGSNTAVAKTTEELRKLADERLRSLLAAYRMEVATSAEVEELVVLYRRAVDALAAGNLELEERIRLTQQVRDITGTVPGLQAPEIQPPALPTDLRLPTIGTDPIVDLMEERNRLARLMAEQWMEENAGMVAASQRAAIGIAGAFQDAFSALTIEMRGISQSLGTLLQGAGAAALGFLADLAGTKVQENVVRALENVALAKGYTAVGNFPGAAAASAAAKDHALAAAGWAALGGVAAASQAAVSGGGRGGLAGGLPSSSRDPAGRLADSVERSGATTYIYVNPFDPSTPAIQSAAYEAVLARAQKAGGRVRLVYQEGR